MQTRKTIVLGYLAAVVVSMIFAAGWGITSAYAQVNNLTSKAAPGGMQGKVVRDSAVMLFEEKTIHANGHVYPDDTRHNISALNNKGLALEKLGNYSGAILYYKKVLAIQPNNTNTLDNIGMALNNLGNYTGAIEYFNRALAINPNDETALYNKGYALLNLGFPSF